MLPLMIVAALGACILGLDGCTLGTSTDPGLEKAIRSHYASYATEELGHCRSPKIDTIQSHEPGRKADNGGEVMLVRYSYYDQHADMDANYSRLFHLAQECGGLAQREFTLQRTDLGYRVTAMGGEQQSVENAR